MSSGVNKTHPRLKDAIIMAENLNQLIATLEMCSFKTLEYFLEWLGDYQEEVANSSHLYVEERHMINSVVIAMIRLVKYYTEKENQ